MDSKVIMEKFNALKDAADKKLSKIEYMNQIEELAGVNKVYVALGGALLLLLVVYFGFGLQLVCNLIGFIYPSYASFKSCKFVNFLIEFILLIF